MTDAAEHVLIVDGNQLIVGGKHVTSVLGAIEKAVKNDVRKAAEAAALAELDAPAISLLPTLPPIIGVSEKQSEYATRVREERFVLAMRACVRHIAAYPETADDVEPIRAELTTNADARFWLDVVENTDGGINAGHTLRRIAQYMRSAGRAPSNA